MECRHNPVVSLLGGRSHCLPAVWLRGRQPRRMGQADSRNPGRKAPLTSDHSPARLPSRARPSPTHPPRLRWLEPTLLVPGGIEFLLRFRDYLGMFCPLSSHPQGIHANCMVRTPRAPPREKEGPPSRGTPAWGLSRSEMVPKESSPRSASHPVCRLFVLGRGNGFGKPRFGVRSASGFQCWGHAGDKGWVLNGVLSLQLSLRGWADLALTSSVPGSSQEPGWG